MGGMNWKIGIGIYTLLCIKEITNENLTYGEKIETLADFIFLDSKITMDSDCNHEIKKMLAPWKKRYDKPSVHACKVTSVVSDSL